MRSFHPLIAALTATILLGGSSLFAGERLKIDLSGKTKTIAAEAKNSLTLAQKGLVFIDPPSLEPPPPPPGPPGGYPETLEDWLVWGTFLEWLQVYLETGVPPPWPWDDPYDLIP